MPAKEAISYSSIIKDNIEESENNFKVPIYTFFNEARV